MFNWFRSLGGVVAVPPDATGGSVDGVMLVSSRDVEGAGEDLEQEQARSVKQPFSLADPFRLAFNLAAIKGGGVP